jgi:hypothetical protein
LAFTAALEKQAELIALARSGSAGARGKGSEFMSQGAPDFEDEKEYEVRGVRLVCRSQGAPNSEDEKDYELQAVRLVCPNASCGAVVKVSFERLDDFCPGPECPSCKQMLAEPAADGFEFLGRLLGAPEDSTSTSEFVLELPEEDWPRAAGSA